MQDSPQTPADITNSNSIPASLRHACNKMLIGWRDKWVSKVEELQQQAEHQKWLLDFLNTLSLYIDSTVGVMKCVTRSLDSHL